MPTIKDIAAKAGVSHGTVSNVLNKRGNVSAEKIQLVEQVAKEMGYKMNVQAQQLRAGMSRKVFVILPKISLKRYNDLYTGMERYLGEHGFDVELVCTDNLEYNEEHAIRNALTFKPVAVVLVSSRVKNRGQFEAGTKFIFVERKVKGAPEGSLYASFPFDEAGRDIAVQCIRDGHKNTALFCENSTFSNNKSFVNAVQDVFEDYNCACQVFPSDDSVWLNRAFDILNSEEDFDSVIAMCDEDVEYIKMAWQYHKAKKMPDIYALTSKAIGIKPDVKRYELNYKLLGRRIAGEILRGGCEDREKCGQPEAGTILLGADGFYQRWPLIHREEKSISFLITQNLTSRAIRKLLPLFTEETGIRVNLIEASYDEHYQMSKACMQSSPYDLIRIDMAWMAEFGNKIFRELDEQDESVQWIRGQLIPTLSDDYSCINGKYYAFPLDACVQMLFYRKDMFRNELIKREFFEKHKRKLKIPKTFAEYNEIAAFFTKKLNPDARTQYGTTATFGRSSLAACDCLPRFREYNKSIFDADGRVDVLQPEMRKAIQNYLQTCACAGNGNGMAWAEASKRFSEGKTAMHIVFLNYAAEMIHDENSKVVGRVAFGPVPGGQPFSGGGTVGISRFSSQYEACMTFLRWLYQRETAETLTYLGGYVCNREVGKNMDIVELYPWLEGIEDTFKPGWRIYKSEGVNPRFNEFHFENILGRAIRSIASGIEDMDTALFKAQAECDEAFAADGAR